MAGDSGPPRGARRVAAHASRLALLLAGLFAGAGLAEAFLRVRGVVYNVVARHPDPTLRYTLKPGLRTRLGGILHEYNSRGLRDREVPDRAGPGTTRILVVGDSIAYAEAVPVESTFPRRLEDALNHATPWGGRFEVLNGGVAGYNACQEESFYRNIGSTLHPDIVVWQYCLNDIDTPWDPYGVEGQGYVPLPAWVKQTLRDHVVLWSFARVKMYLLFQRLGLQRDMVTEDDYARHVFGLYGKEGEAARDAAWQCLARAKRAIQSDGGRMLLVVFPFRMQLGQGEFDEAPQQDVILRGRGEEMAVLDLLPTFRDHPDDELFAVPDFIHLSREGHRVTGEAIARDVRKMMEP